MSRRKGEITGHMNERDFLHLVARAAACRNCATFLPELHAREKSKKALVLDFLFERDLRAW